MVNKYILRNFQFKSRINTFKNLIFNKANLNFLLKKIWFFISAVSIVGGLLAYSLFFPRISVYQPTVILDLNNPFATPFIIKNDGYLPIYKIESEMKIRNMKDSGNITISDSTFKNRINNSSVLLGNKETSINIEMGSFISGIKPPIKEATIEIRVSYKPLILYWSHSEMFVYTVFHSSDGTSYWFPKNN